MKKLLIAVGLVLVVLGIVLVNRPARVGATVQDQCNQVFEYTNQVNDSRVFIDTFNTGAQGNPDSITVTAKSGYVVTDVFIELSENNTSGWDVQVSGNQSSFNPQGEDIESFLVKVKKVCATPTPTATSTPTPTVTPTSTPTPTPTPTPDPCSQELKVAFEEGPYPEEPCVTPTPEVTPEPTPTPCTGNCGGWSPRPEGERSTTQAPVCTNGEVVRQPANAHVARYGDKADVNFFITEGDSANVYWRVVGTSMWIASSAAEFPEGVKPNGDRYVSYTAKNLDPNLGYEFGIQQKNGCGGGAVYVVVDGPVKTIFREWYWEIS